MPMASAAQSNLVGMFEVHGGPHCGLRWYCDGRELTLTVPGLTPAPLRFVYALRVLMDARGTPWRGWEYVGIEGAEW
jgi:hypothetical protein